MDNIYTFSHQIIAVDYATAKQAFINKCFMIKDDIEEVFTVEAEEYKGEEELLNEL